MHRCPAYLLAALTFLACGDDTGAGGATSSSTTTSTTNPTSSPSSTSATNPTATSTSATNGTSASNGTGGSYEGVDPIDGIAPVELVQEGFDFTEGPCWFPALGVLRFSDIPNNRIHEVAADDTITTWRENSGGTNGIALAGNGRLVACEGQNRQVTISDADVPGFSVIVSEYMGDRFNAPNDAIVRADGTLYFTDPDYGLPQNEHEIGFNGVYWVSPQGDVSLVSDQLQLPNGIALSPDQTTLYVADNGRAEMIAFDVMPGGGTGPGTKIFDTSPGPDGMAVDVAGNLYITTSAGVDVVRPDGTSWGTIDVPRQPANCTFGGADGKTLYITAREGFYKVTLNVPGLP